MKLMLTLGHNSSAVLVRDESVLCGYEEERLSHVKSDSSFPALSIAKILEYFPEARYEVKEVYVSHWFWSFELPESKYYRPKHISANFPNAKVISHDDYNTHHDLHAKSMWNFCDGDTSGLTIVADGFGNFGECLSIYSDARLIHRSYSVLDSLGLMYQYATAYLGMKENQDEYKLLGYEQQCSSQYKVNIEDAIADVSLATYNELMKVTPRLYDMEGMLKIARSKWNAIFTYASPDKSKPEIAYFVQSVLERVMYKILTKYDNKNVKVSGGIFYNVKLNNMILRWSDKFEANPLSGDQGCAIGFTKVRYSHLYWGLRDLETKLLGTITADEIDVIGYSEVFRGNMEFGPRALCNTTTLAKPELEIVEKINSVNGRDTVMPMAPVVTEWYAEKNFNDLEKVSKSKYFMIIAFDFKEGVVNETNRGAAHIDSDRQVYTGRIQIATEKELVHVLNAFGGILINTSLNAHGQPIIYDENDFKAMRAIQLFSSIN